jgi:hypothetical protein
MAPYLSAGQSNSGDWRYASQILKSDGEPAWGASPPSGLVVTITIVDQRRCERLSTSSDDGTGAVTVQPNGYFTIALPASRISALGEGLYDVHMQTDAGGFRSEFVLGRLPILQGA